MKVRMQIHGFEVKLNGPMEAIAAVVELCKHCAKVYDADYEELVFTGERLVERDGFLVLAYQGPPVARRISDLEADRTRLIQHNHQHNQKLFEGENEKANGT